MYPTDEELEVAIDIARANVIFLTECKEARAIATATAIKEQKVKDEADRRSSFLLHEHRPLTWIRETIKRSHGAVVKVTSVTCTCGQETHYKTPLNTIDDFTCPKARQNAG